jgi:hypothetical protein
VDITPGYHKTYITCRTCRHQWNGVMPDNWIVGKTHRFVCSKCSSRDVSATLSWVWGDPPTAKVIPLPIKRPGTRPG